MRLRTALTFAVALAAAVIVVPALCGTTAAHATAAPARWIQPGYGSAHRNDNPHELHITADTVATLSEQWRVATGAAVSPPVVSGARVLISSGRATRVITRRTGRTVWQVEHDDPTDSLRLGTPLLIDDRTSLVTLSWMGGAGAFRYDLVDGTFTGGPVAHGGTTQVTVRNGRLTTVNLMYGSGGPLIYSLGYGQSGAGLLFCCSFTGPRVSAASVHAGRVFVVVDQFLLQFRTDRCIPLPQSNLFCVPERSATLPGIGMTPVVFSGGVAVAGHNGVLTVHAPDTAIEAWRTTIPTTISALPAVARGRIYVAGNDGMVYVVPAAGCGATTCTARAKFPTGAAITTQPMVAGDVLYAGTQSGTVVAFAADGCARRRCSPLRRFDVDGTAVTSGPVVTGGTLLAGTAGGTFAAFARP